MEPCCVILVSWIVPRDGDLYVGLLEQGHALHCSSCYFGNEVSDTFWSWVIFFFRSFPEVVKPPDTPHTPRAGWPLRAAVIHPGKRKPDLDWKCLNSSNSLLPARFLVLLPKQSWREGTTSNVTVAGSSAPAAPAPLGVLCMCVCARTRVFVCAHVQHLSDPTWTETRVGAEPSAWASTLSSVI